MTIRLYYASKRQTTRLVARVISALSSLQLPQVKTPSITSSIDPKTKPNINKTNTANKPSNQNASTPKSMLAATQQEPESTITSTMQYPSIDENSPEKKPSRVQHFATQAVRSITAGLKGIYTSAKQFLNGSFKEINSDRKKYALASIITLTPVVSMLAIYINPLLGTYINSITLAILATIAIANENIRKLSISVAILPIIHLFNLSVPQNDLLLRTVIFYSLLLLLTLIYRYLFTLDAPNRKVSLKAIIALQALLIVTIILGQWQYTALQAYFPFGIDSVALTVFIFILFAVIEEAYFRGLVQAQAIEEVGKKYSVILASVLFGFSFIGPDKPLALVLGVVFGVILSALYVVRRSLILNIAANMLCKLVLIVLITIIG